MKWTTPSSAPAACAVVFHNGDAYMLDRGRDLGMTNRLMRAPA